MPALLIFQTVIGYAIIAAAGRFLDFVVLCVSILMPFASIQALHTFGSFIGDAIVVAARKCLFLLLFAFRF